MVNERVSRREFLKLAVLGLTSISMSPQPGTLNLQGDTRLCFFKFLRYNYPNLYKSYKNLYKSKYASKKYRTKVNSIISKLHEKYNI